MILVDLPSWPSVSRRHAWSQPPFIAPTLDLNVAFHQAAGDEEWLLCDGSAPLSSGGHFGWTARCVVTRWPAARIGGWPVPVPRHPIGPGLTGPGTFPNGRAVAT